MDSLHTSPVMHKNWMYFYHIAQHGYQNKATIKSMVKYQEECHQYKDVLSPICTTKSTKHNSEALTKQQALDKQVERSSDSAWKNVSASGKRACNADNTMQLKSDFVQHLGNKWNFNFVMITLSNHFPDNIHQLGNPLYTSSELREWVMLNLDHAYQQLNGQEPTF